ncbi:hypothetical protein ACEPAG_7740 [Sanghuangporus baumii]
MALTEVAIIGAGIAGPVLAMLLKQKGYIPVLYERAECATSGGLSLALQPNGFKVLSLIPGLLEGLPGRRITHTAVFSTITNRTLVFHDAPSRAGERYNSSPELGIRGVQRERFHRYLVEQSESRDIIIHWSHQLQNLEEVDEDCVELHFANGKTARASFVIGCDGLHSNARSALFGDMKPDYTGLVQTGGMSPRPQTLKNIDAMCNFLGAHAHMVAYPITDEYYSWAMNSLTQPEEEHKESWRSIDEDRKEAFKKGPFSRWGSGAGDMVKTTTKVIKYGLYDRPELKTWYKGRVVLLGDAAHPTTPHLGQGANQAFEDIYHLVRALTMHHPSPITPATTSQLTAAFAEYERVRLPRSSELVRRARARGDKRVENIDFNNLEAMERRENIWKEELSEDNIWNDMDVYAKGTYEGRSEI